MRIVVAIDARDTAIDGTDGVTSIVVGAPVTQMTGERTIGASRVCGTTRGIVGVIVHWLWFGTSRTDETAVNTANGVTRRVVRTPVTGIIGIADFTSAAIGAYFISLRAILLTIRVIIRSSFVTIIVMGKRPQRDSRIFGGFVYTPSVINYGEITIRIILCSQNDGGPRQTNK
jgi:hypothetical protein